LIGFAPLGCDDVGLKIRGCYIVPNFWWCFDGS
jgi:hypothetical protein